MAKKPNKKKKTGKPTAGPKPLSENQLKKLIRHVRASATAARLHGNSRAVVDELIVDLLVEAGLKPKELCALCLKDTPAIQSENAITVRSKLGHRARSISISQPLAERLNRFATVYRPGANPKDPLILSERGNPLGYFSIYSKIRRIGQAAGIKNLQPNTLRKTYITNLYSREQDLRWVQQQAGHSSPKTTALYVQTNAGQPKSRGKIAAKPKSKSIPRKKCEACGRRVSINRIAQIDSGQVLCTHCLDELHG